MNNFENDFQGRRVLITGATSVIGREISRSLAEHDAQLVLVGRNEESLKDVLDGVKANDHKAIIANLDDPAELSKTIKPRLSEMKPIYGFCHCAGVVYTRSLAMSKTDIIQKQIDVNVLAGIEIARMVAGREIATTDEGSIVFISSIYSHVGATGQVGYCLSKGALNAATRALAVELAQRKIKVNTVSPGFVRTSMTESQSKLSKEQIQNIIEKHPLGEGAAGDIARAVLFLMSPANKWITGSDLKVDGGYTAQ